ncbi:hypothetical protein KEM48_002822 [Puccinia striiformis f. sp. tritici PST-130]|nr:hypothetical protein KEM48_002822 [Puccinia striiformis f. sp. tritici PST-130]
MTSPFLTRSCSVQLLFGVAANEVSDFLAGASTFRQADSDSDFDRRRSRMHVFVRIPGSMSIWVFARCNQTECQVTLGASNKTLLTVASLMIGTVSVNPDSEDEIKSPGFELLDIIDESKHAGSSLEKRKPENISLKAVISVA